MDRTSFYGGPSGQSFQIKRIFKSKKEMQEDLQQRWQSPIGVSDFVIISYGLPNDYNYYYIDSSGNKVNAQEADVNIESDGSLSIIVDGIKYTVTRVSVSQDREDDDLDLFNKTYNSTLWQKIYTENNQNEIDALTGIETFYISGNYGLGYKLIASMSGKTPTIIFKYNALDANQLPYITVDNLYIDKPVITFYLPQSQVMQDPVIQVVAPLDPPDVDLNNTNINKPFLEFKLPRAIKFYYGNLKDLGKRVNATSNDPSVADYAPGDYYIHENTGFIYQVTANNDGTVNFQYVACIQMPAPGVSTNPINPYTADGADQAMPSVTPSYDDPDQQLGYRLNFNLPKLPTFSVSSPPTFVGSMENGAASLTPNSETNVNLELTLPSATRIFAGDEVVGDPGNDVSNATVAPDPVIGSPLPGDLYLNTATGIVYKLNTDNVWKFQNKGLKGPPGDSLNIVRSYSLTIGDDYAEDNLDNGVDYIKNNYLDTDGVTRLPYSPDELFAITWIDPNNNNMDTSYWYFYTEQGIWGRVQITGALSDFIQNTYTPSPDTSPVTTRAYSVDYVNKLIGGDITTNSARTTFSKDQIYALLSWGTFQQAVDGSWWPGS